MSGHMPTFERIPNDPYRATAHGTRRALRILWEGEGLETIATGSDRIAMLNKLMQGWRWVGWQDGADGARVSVYRRTFTDAGNGEA